MATASDLLREARSELGYHEGPRNHTKYGEWYAREHRAPAFAYAPWCDMFVSWCAASVGLDDVVGDFAYTPYHAGWFANAGDWGHTPRRGAIVFYDWSGTRTISRIDHVGIVETIRSDGRIITLEGNTDNAVRRRVRSQAYVAGFGYPAWVEAASGPHRPAQPASHPHPADRDREDDVILDRLPLLKRGAHDERGHTHYVSRVQCILRDVMSISIGPAGVDGDYGPDTERAVKILQRRRGLKVDGEVGDHTWSQLYTGRDL